MLDEERMLRALGMVKLCKPLDFVEEARKVTTLSPWCLQSDCDELIQVRVKVTRIFSSLCSLDSFRSNEVFFCAFLV